MDHDAVGNKEVGSATGDIEWIPLIPGFSGFLPTSPTGPGQGVLARMDARTAESAHSKEHATSQPSTGEHRTKT
ncbi:hypothetical protein FPOAC1_004449 [Fusarium poae]|uniref:hypothetical protein n=1 Tax=Fusarium poae TaxID=36050 RepID=UPI001CEB8164|nr:hypothetical protein FPOAC1_004449 [Fusarium poae]KAG8671208.1 hypothetical protein FPOAC1_004449 [Fusarium poae]